MARTRASRLSVASSIVQPPFLAERPSLLTGWSRDDRRSRHGCPADIHRVIPAADDPSSIGTHVARH
jgi:hypothetical protein